MNEELRAALLAQAEARAAFNAAGDDADEAQLAELRSALEAADQAVVERLEQPQQETAELRDRISLARYMEVAADQRSIDGAERELNRELGLADNTVPLEALLPTVEERADAVSPQQTDGDPLASGDINTSTGPLLTRLFTRTDAAFLGVTMPTVPAGERVYPVMTAGTSAAMQARGAQPDAGAAKFGMVNATPHRLTGRYVFDLEGVSELGGLLESTLRNDLRTELGFQMDSQILNGTNADNQVNGLMTALPLTLPPGSTFSTNDPSAVIAWDTFRRAFTEGLDGKLSRMESDFRALIGQASYGILRNAYRNANAGDSNDAVAAVRTLGSRIQQSFQIAAPAVATISPKTKDSTKMVQSMIVSSEPGAAVAPVWQGITLIRDPYTNAGKAQIVLTAHMLFDFVLRRTDGWKRYALRTET